MLEDTTFADVVSWGPGGDCFVVKDMNEFTKSILPRMFKHSNFASFVRQLNKYDFHKVRHNNEESGQSPYGAGVGPPLPLAHYIARARTNLCCLARPGNSNTLTLK